MNGAVLSESHIVGFVTFVIGGIVGIIIARKVLEEYYF